MAHLVGSDVFFVQLYIAVAKFDLAGLGVFRKKGFSLFVELSQVAQPLVAFFCPINPLPFFSHRSLFAFDECVEVAIHGAIPFLWNDPILPKCASTGNLVGAACANYFKGALKMELLFHRFYERVELIGTLVDVRICFYEP